MQPFDFQCGSYRVRTCDPLLVRRDAPPFSPYLVYLHTLIINELCSYGII